MSSGGRSGRVWIINEAHAVSAGAVDSLLTFLDSLPPNTVLVFTTTRKPDEGIFGTDDGPMMSRCVRVTLTNQGLSKSFGARLAAIARAEGLDGGKPDDHFVKILAKYRNNLRAAIQDVWSGSCLSDSDKQAA